MTLTLLEYVTHQNNKILQSSIQISTFLIRKKHLTCTISKCVMCYVTIHIHITRIYKKIIKIKTYTLKWLGLV
jgi:hypothetical protein